MDPLLGPTDYMTVGVQELPQKGGHKRLSAGSTNFGSSIWHHEIACYTLLSSHSNATYTVSMQQLKYFILLPHTSSRTAAVKRELRNRRSQERALIRCNLSVLLGDPCSTQQEFPPKCPSHFKGKCF